MSLKIELLDCLLKQRVWPNCTGTTLAAGAGTLAAWPSKRERRPIRMCFVAVGYPMAAR